MAACRTACSVSREGITMSVARTLRKMLGWCPNASVKSVGAPLPDVEVKNSGAPELNNSRKKNQEVLWR